MTYCGLVRSRLAGSGKLIFQYLGVQFESDECYRVRVRVRVRVRMTHSLTHT